MSILAIRAALLLALFGVVTGNLYRPCDCARDANSASHHARCCAKTRTTDLPPCCRGKEAPAKDRPDGKPHDGCRICCKPRPPLAQTIDVVAVPAAFVQALPLDVTTLVVPVATSPAALRRDEADRRTSDPWQLSPEGLATFLI